MIVNREIQTFKLLPITISELAEKLNIYPGSASKIIEKLIKNGLAKKQREGKHVLIVKERSRGELYIAFFSIFCSVIMYNGCMLLGF